MAKKIKPQAQRSFFQNVEYFFDKAAQHTKYPQGLLTQIKACNSIYQMSFPVRLGDNKYEVIEAYRIEHSHHKNPTKGGIRFFEVNGGVIEVKNNKIIVLAETAKT